MKNIFIFSRWPLTYFIAFVFPGVWLPQRRKSRMLLVVLVLCLQTFSLYAHVVCFVEFCHGSTRGMNTAINFRLLRFMVLQIVYLSLYIICLVYFYCVTNIESWKTVLRRKDWIYVNISSCISLLLFPFVVNDEKQRRTVTDVVATLVSDCSLCKLKCDLLSTMLVISAYLGLFTMVIFGCLIFVALKTRWNLRKWKNRLVKTGLINTKNTMYKIL